MALDNMTTEPRREITETVVGVVFVGAVLYASYLFAGWFADACNEPRLNTWFGTIIGMVVGVVALFVTFVGSLLLTAATHGAGEIICDILEGWGLQMRPLQRYKRDRDNKVVPIPLPQSATNALIKYK